MLMARVSFSLLYPGIHLRVSEGIANEASPAPRHHSPRPTDQLGLPRADGIAVTALPTDVTDRARIAAATAQIARLGQ
jgi:hypothetical protein